MTKQLFLADRHGQVSEFTKAPQPRLGEKFGIWAGRDDMQVLTLPGGGMLMFDLDRLTLADYRAMRNHYQIHISLTVLTFLMHEIDWRIEHPDDRIRKHCEDNMKMIWTRLIRGICVSHWAGFSPLVLQFENDVTGRRVMVDQVKDLVPEECTVNWKTVEGYAPSGHAKPKHYIFDGIKQRGASVPIPVEHSLWVPCLMEHGNYYGRKLLKPAFPSWFFSQIIHLYANRYFERFGEPIVVGRAPLEEKFDFDGSGTMKSGRTIMLDIMNGMRNRSVVAMPNDRDPNITNGSRNFEWELEYLESQMRGADFERYLDRLDEEMSLALFTPVLLFRTADVGSYNLGQAHHSLFMTMLNAMAGDIKFYLDRYLLARMVDMNFSPNAPRAEWVPRKLGKDTAENLRVMIQSLIQQKIARPNLEELGVALGLTVEEIAEVTADTNAKQLDAEIQQDAADKAVEREIDKARRMPAPSTQNVSNNARALVPRMYERARGQIEKAFREGNFNDTFKLDFGHERQLIDALGDRPTDVARADVGRLTNRLNRWFEEIPKGGSLTEPEVLRMVDKTLEFEIARL